MRIAIACHPTPGGSGVIATELADALARRGHEVHLAAYTRPFRLPADSPVIFHPAACPDYPLFQHPPCDLSFANLLAGIVKDHGVEIIHAHYAVPHCVTALLARDIVQPHPVKVVTTLHGTDITLVGSHRDFFDLVRYAMLRSDALTAPSQWLCDETVQRFQLPTAPIKIPNFVDTTVFFPEGRAPYPAPGEPFQLLHASNMRPVKRISDVIRVFAGVARQAPARLTVVGEGPDKGLAVELASMLGVSDRVEFRGLSREMGAIMRSAHLFLLLSDYESFGVSALEAMASGVPVIGTTGGGLGEVVRDGKTGLLCGVGEVQCITRKAMTILADAGRWERFSRAAARHAPERFDLRAAVNQYEELYRQVLSAA